jgi:hypothetical protein
MPMSTIIQGMLAHLCWLVIAQTAVADIPQAAAAAAAAAATVS